MDAAAIAEADAAAAAAAAAAAIAEADAAAAAAAIAEADAAAAATAATTAAAAAAAGRGMELGTRLAKAKKMKEALKELNEELEGVNRMINIQENSIAELRADPEVRGFNAVYQEFSRAKFLYVKYAQVTDAVSSLKYGFGGKVFAADVKTKRLLLHLGGIKSTAAGAGASAAAAGPGGGYRAMELATRLASGKRKKKILTDLEEGLEALNRKRNLYQNAINEMNAKPELTGFNALYQEFSNETAVYVNSDQVEDAVSALGEGFIGKVFAADVATKNKLLASGILSTIGDFQVLP